MPMAELPDVKLHYLLLEPDRSRTPRTNVVLLHGLAANVAFWYWKIAPALAPANRVLLVDLRGHGLSSMPPSGYTAQVMAEDLKAQLDMLGISRVHLVGHSFGGRIALQFASCYPECVQSLVLVDVLLRPLQPRTDGFAMWTAYHEALAREGIPMEQGDEPSIALLEGLARLRLRYDGAAGVPSVLMAGPFSGSAGRRTASQWLRLLELTTARRDIPRNEGVTPDRLAQVQVPALLVYGEFSPAVPSAVALRRLWPHARLEIVPRAGHFFPVTRPDRLLLALHGFLGRPARAE